MSSLGVVYHGFPVVFSAVSAQNNTTYGFETSLGEFGSVEFPWRTPSGCCHLEVVSRGGVRQLINI